MESEPANSPGRPKGRFEIREISKAEFKNIRLVNPLASHDARLFTFVLWSATRLNVPSTKLRLPPKSHLGAMVAAHGEPNPFDPTIAPNAGSPIKPDLLFGL